MSDIAAPAELAAAPLRLDAPGVFSGIPMDVYLTDPVAVPSLSSSVAITLIQQSPFHAWARHPRNPKCLSRDESRVASIGTVAHALLLEKSEDQVVVLDPQNFIGKRGGIPKGYTNDAIREARDDALAEGKTPLLLEDMITCRAMRDAAQEYIAHSELAGVFDAGESEATVVAQEGATWLRCRPDWISHDKSVVVHFKTTARSARPESFIRGLLPSMGYDLALAFYGRVIAGATGVVPKIHCILAQEQDPPYCCSLIALSPAYADITDGQIDRAIITWRDCMRTGRWPAYPSRICYAEPKPWQMAEAEEEQINFYARDPEQVKHGIQI